MASETRKTKKILLKDLNSVLTCTLCSGYFVDATTLVDCLHVFCRGCILKHFENSKQGCPTCNKKKTCIRPDPQIQALVYKMVPGLFSRETQRREEFYRMTGVRASSSCSDDSVLGDLTKDREQWISSSVSDPVQFFNPDDSISLSLEYYQHHLDETNCKSAVSEVSEVRVKGVSDKEERVRDRRYLQCPAAVSMSHLQKFLRMKYALSPEHKVDIIYEGEVLPTNYNLMDVAYTFNWTKVKPMRFFYRIFTPLKIQPIKIINTSSSTGTKQLQIVPVKPNSEQKLVDETQNEKERLMAHLKLQSRHKVQEPKETQTKTTEPNCVYEYEEPDKEEIKRFAENRDREWASMRHEEPETHHVKKRKKNKHSKSDVTHKKRKLHAEITGEVKQELKLKVKLTPHNGHKHKHRTQVVESPKEESKDKLLQMRAVRHKSATPENVPKVEEEEKKVEDKEAQKTFLKTFQSNPEGTSKVPEKVPPVKTVEKAVEKRPINTYSNQKAHKSLEKKIATLAQQCTIEAKIEKKVTFSNEKPHILNSSQYPTGFTVSKIEPNLKRKAEELEDKRSGLEITLISPTAEPKPKRPPPATIPLERIKKSSKSGLSIIPKLPEKCDNIVPLDLSKPHKLDINGITTLNGLKTMNNFSKTSQLSNLQMLSKVAAEQSLKKKLTPPPKVSPVNKAKALPQAKPQVPKPQLVQKPLQVKPAQVLAKPVQNSVKPAQITKPVQVSNKAPQPPTQTPNKAQVTTPTQKPRPQIPNLQTIKVPNPQPQKPNLPKLPKLQEISKTHIRLLNSNNIRTMRPTQNQSVRNIPNPSLLVRQQNQNRLSITPIQNGESKEPKILNTLAPAAKDPPKEEPPKVVENGVTPTTPNNVSK